MTNSNITADCIVVPEKVSDAEKVVVNGEEIRNDNVAKIICTDPNFLGRSIKYLFSEYEELSDKEAGKLICDVTVQESNETGTVLDLDTSRKFIDVSFSIAERPIKIKIFLEPNFYKLDLNELVVRSLDYACYYYLVERKEYGSDYEKGVDIYAIWLVKNDELSGSSFVWEGVLRDVSGNIRNDMDITAHLCFHFCFINNRYFEVDKDKDPMNSFFSTVFTGLKDKDDKIRLLDKDQNFQFSEKTKEEIKVNGLAEFYREEDAKEIKRLQDELSTKDEKIKADNIATLKGMMAAFNVDFDTAFTVSGFDTSLKEEYRKLVEEK